MRPIYKPNQFLTQNPNKMLTEVNEQGMLAGVDITTIAKLSPSEQMAALIAVIAEVSKPKSKGSRAELFRFGAEVEKDVAEKLAKGQLQAIDYEVICVVPAPSGSGRQSIKFFETNSTILKGLNTFKEGRAEKDFNMIVTQVALQAGVAAGTTTADIAAAQFEDIDQVPCLRNAFLHINFNKRPVLMDFPTSSLGKDSLGDKGAYLTLDNPKMIKSLEPVWAEIEIEDGAGMPANTFVALKLKGTATFVR